MLPDFPADTIAKLIKLAYECIVVRVGEPELRRLRDGAIQDIENDAVSALRDQFRNPIRIPIRLECNLDPWPGELKNCANQR